MLFVGDVMLGRLVNAALKEVPPEYPWGNTLPIFKKAELRICNLECVVSDRGSPWTRTPKVFHFRTDAKNVRVLRKAGIDAVSLANNHSLDFGYDALAEMLEILDREKIENAGAGMDFERASRPAIFSRSGIQFGLVSFTDNERPWEAGEQTPGVFYTSISLHDPRAKKVFERVREAKAQVDFLIVAIHWGPNWGYRPQPAHIPFGKALIDAGADLIFGHSCHVFQGVEIYESRPILYSCGDFVDDYAVDQNERNDQSFIFMVELQDKNVRRIRFYPTIIDNFQARLAETAEAEDIALKMQRLCAEFQTPSVWNQEEHYLEISNGAK